ncbi:MAG: NAD(P)H-quinone oxidoreductase [Acidobacteria bacterium]|nr:NAD(P)H-quinone oxidoreductase [Acidobacteriota bacterium]
MKAVFINEFGGAENLEFRVVDDPSPPAAGKVLVSVKAAALNRADLLQRQGFYPAPAGYPERIPGLEFAGVIAEIGADVTDFKAGDRVFGITAGGAQAEFLLIDQTHLAKIPANLNLVEAAAVPEAFITAHDAVFTQAKLQPGETLLIHAVGSGVGLAALQLAKARNATVFGTSRTPEKLERCREFGLDGAFSTADFAENLRGKANVILDLVGAGVFARNLECLALKGRLILVGLVGGRKTEFDLGLALTKRLTIIGTVLRSRSAAEKAAATSEFIEKVAPLLVAGTVRPNLDRVFPAEEVSDAHRYLESNQSFGKVVLEF